ncbi:MAG: glutathione peroxidase [Brevundimonas sp.]|jgi:glutathione peroxidase|uniref:glutathione peroxidase n=1 Tax=Brevundimonas sp. TaxID=1871086 RepID=UPI003918FF2A
MALRTGPRRAPSLAAMAVMALALAACGRTEPPTPEVEAERNAAVAEAVREQQALFASARAADTQDEGRAYAYTFEGLTAPSVPMTAFEGQVILVVNTASQCGFTGQYEGLQQIYGEYRDQGLVVLGVPSGNFNDQEFAEADDIREFCTTNFGVTFPMAGRTDVIGDNAHPFYRWARAELGESAVPGWNFHKILIDRQGRAVAAFGSRVEPTSDQLRAAIRQLL